MPQNNQISAPTGSYIPRNGRAIELWFSCLTNAERHPRDEDGFTYGHTAWNVPPAIAAAFEDCGLVEGRKRATFHAREYRITDAGREALAEYQQSLMMAPREADNFLRYRALQRLSPDTSGAGIKQGEAA
jgi:hypothetical protein